MDERYKAYLESDWWKTTREKYIKSIGNKCECCGKPFDLQVHHLTYEHLGFERDYELKCLCRNCHQWIEEQKRNGFIDRKTQIELLEARKDYIENPGHLLMTAIQVFDVFSKYCIANDLSAGGKFNFENISIIRSQYLLFCKENSYPHYEISVSRIQEIINPRRYRVILEYISKGYPKYETCRITGFSNSMISKVYKNPEAYRKICNQLSLFDFI